ncbi:TIGR00269 family protein [Aciduliprofundum sp. MAR08-339]|uniref:TIGR00269 family protein n=1 Tax=Aciduliprofundum sp. (strain MAR08-339) TaxID=673860 RepID=UPI0002A4A9FC|nr:TIGR00269 family protein [Aciduliprofundum sp. MAR08-339]
MKCSKCNKDAITEIRYAGTHLCKDHFLQFIDRKVKREIREQAHFKKDDRILIAVSGGKDSMLTLYQMHKIFGNWRDLELLAVTVDEGIGDFRRECAKIAKKYANDLEIEHSTISFKEYIGITTDDVVQVDKELKPCTYCGVFRRKVLNMYAREIGANYLVLGLNLDDVAQSIIMNITRGDNARLSRLAPHKKIREGFIPRIIPLRKVREEEVRLYVKLADIPYHPGRCPYAPLAIRDLYREFLDKLESRDPAVKFSILNFFDEIKPYIEEKYRAKLHPCKICGEPTTGEICKACELKMRYETMSKEVQWH